MTAKFTEGPWHWDCDPVKNDPLNRVRYRVTTVGKTITQCYYSSADEQAKHDAALIAAAPELYALAVKRRDYLAKLVEVEQAWRDDPSVVAELAEYDAALAKARGEP